MLAQLVTNTFQHPFTLQIVFLWVAVVPIALVGLLIFLARVKGDRAFKTPHIASDRIRAIKQ